MAAKECTFKCLMCDHEFAGMYDAKNVTERSCPQCRSNSVRRLPAAKATKK
jgi:Zn finger protein HypA/HybF involved in hydrogenase expression